MEIWYVPEKLETHMKKILFLGFVCFGSINTYAAGFSYKCYSYYWNGNNDKGTMSLVINGNLAKADILEVQWDNNLGGILNVNYKPQGSMQFIKYGTNLIVEKALVLGGRKLDNVNFGGIARIEGIAEGGFYQYKFLCRRE